MSFCFNFSASTDAGAFEKEVEKDSQHEGINKDAKSMEDNPSPAEPAKEAKQHFLPSSPQSLLEYGVFETITVGSLPALHLLNETVFEKTISEREDVEQILSRCAKQNSDLISGVYEGGLKVWECTYDLLEQIEKNSETFSGKAVLDLGCGAGLLGILALKRGADPVHFQDYNSTVIEQLTIPNVFLNCQEDDKEDEECEEKGKGKSRDSSGCKKETDQKIRSDSPPGKKRAVDMSQHTLLRKCHFFSGDWRAFLPLLQEKEPQLKFDIIFSSETIYNTAYYPALHETLHKLLAPDGLVYLATKSHYFGVGGGLHLFETFVEQKNVFSVDHLWDAEEGLQRHVVALRFRKDCV